MLISLEVLRVFSNNKNNVPGISILTLPVVLDSSRDYSPAVSVGRVGMNDVGTV